MRLTASVACLVLTVSFAAAAAAQETPKNPADSTAPPEVTPADTGRAQKLEPVAVRATRGRYVPGLNRSGLKSPVLLRDVPQSVSVVSSQMIRDGGMQSLADVARYIPGITAGQGEGNRDQMILRGNSSTADFYVDGVRDDVQYFRDIFNVESVEALKGPNAMIFGRGGGGGVINRVMKQADFNTVRDVSAEVGAYDHRRFSADLGQALSPSMATRLTSMYQSSRSFRNGVDLERYGVNPTLSFSGPNTSVAVGYEHFQDHRTADRGIPSFEGRPFEANRSTFFGDPRASHSDARVNAATATITHQAPAGVILTSRTRFAGYDKFYSNVFPGAVSATGTTVSISAYDNATTRRNFFTQADAVLPVFTGRINHTMVLGAEAGRQSTDNFRRTGYFNGTATATSMPVSSPTISAPLEFRQSATDADNHVDNTVLSLYGQDQIRLSQRWQIVAGLRYESFDIDFQNNRDDSSLSRQDGMISPRVGLVYKPRAPISLYSSASVSYLPSSGDQFSALTEVTRALEPERFVNYETGLKWDVSDRLAFSAAAYRLDRDNTRANDPTDPARILQTGSQRTNGFELDLRGELTQAWEVAGGYSWQNAFISSATTAAPRGARVPLVPRAATSLWNRVRLTDRVALGAGIIHQSKSFAAIDNTVTLPAFTKLDGAAYYAFGRNLRAQINVENVFNARYYPTANNNNNISPGAPRTLRFSVTTGF
ncbi:MAG TPA: TonB-dependent siderophore receptor [Gemmatimonadaceae bacterium]|nr:TonB-dependent siderophore receptor [Gemmatimonadaceae bacterium]